MPRKDRKNSNPIRVIAFDPDQPVMNNYEIEGRRAVLKVPFTVLMDRKSKREYGRHDPGVERELSGQTVRVAGTFALGTDFTSDGSVVMSDATFARLYPDAYAPAHTLDMADVGVVKLQPGADLDATRKAVADQLPSDLAVYTKDEFIHAEKKYWQSSTPIGFIFQFGLWMGFIVGGVICYQIISTDVAEHLAEFATLKAIGYHDGYLNLTVLRETWWLAVFGFVPGLALSWLLYRLLDLWVGLPMYMTPLRILLIFSLTMAMCLLSGLLALRKVKTPIRRRCSDACDNAFRSRFVLGSSARTAGHPRGTAQSFLRRGAGDAQAGAVRQ